MSELPNPVVIGHRGASGYRPEHSEEAYRLAFELGADLVEPDLVVSRDGVLVLRHENNITDTTDIADRPEFAEYKTVKTVDGIRHEGWFTEDLTWAQIATLKCRERLPELRHDSVLFNDRSRVLCLADLIALIGEEEQNHGRPLGMVAEIKHSAYFASQGFAMNDLFLQQLTGWGERALIVESFELSALTDLRERGLNAKFVYLIDEEGSPADEVAALGEDARTYASYATPEALASFAPAVNGVSLAKSFLLDELGSARVAAAHAAGLLVYTWTLRPENAFLIPENRGHGDDAHHGDWRTEYHQILETGVDGVFADQPDLAYEARAEFWAHHREG
ncbi:glycerophosphodiester phosphodiesterase family protein [Mycetocola saprophilus]|uniref:glycerophosphodiester phosphodiesterase family protein n=1 Tax=Mycetocola saprophilus TaxID=76636 RepID=UPI0004C23D34|nr:glycerophosphodiester phosphodiesterase family protein [Mycetocola saprophilus]